MTNHHHEVFKALAPIDWDTINQDDLKTFLTDTFTDAQSLIDSIPISLTSKSTPSASNGRPRSATDPAGPRLPERAPKISDRAEHLRKEWKEVQVNPRENPLGVNVYKMSSKDKKGAWFARRSLHHGLSFDQWKHGMQAEFAESLKVQGGPGEGKIRGIGADQKVVDTTVDGCGRMEVYQLSAQFPGPTTPRDFVTLLLSSDSAVDPPEQQGAAKARNGYIRGQYESVEFIREIKIEKPLRKVRSSIDLSHDDAEAAELHAAEALEKDALARSARSAAMSSSTSDTAAEGRKRGKTISFAGTEEDAKDPDDVETLVEWLMVTRSDPGGSVPRFMVEKGTPAGIATDAEKFMKWVQARDSAKTTKASDEVDEVHEAPSNTEVQQADQNRETVNPVISNRSDSTLKPNYVAEEEAEGVRPGGFYGMIAEALGAVAARLPNPLGSAKGGDTDTDLSQLESVEDDSDSSSVQSFHSIDSDLDADSKLSKTDSINDLVSPVASNHRDGEAQSTHSTDSAAGKSTAPSHHEKELRKLEEKKRKASEKIARAQERAIARKDTDAKSDEAAIAKLKEKHDREIQKQEEKYQRDLKRIEEKRAREQRKAEEARRKQAEKEAKQNLSMELEKVRAERDVALKQVDVLREQVGELQGQNTLLVAKLASEPASFDSTRSIKEKLRRGLEEIGVPKAFARRNSEHTGSVGNRLRREFRILTADAAPVRDL
ncbi:reticulocyte-binding protein 2 like protein a [Seiridium cupressi]